jgi:uncharacterized protein YyaL (SSP411 family)
VVADFWWTAQLWQLVMDSYERGHRSSDRALIDRVYDGFVARNPTFSSDFNDDRGWWALAATRAYQLTGERRFLLRAESLFAGIWRSWDTHYGGGIWWRTSTHDQKNMATNAPAVVTAIRLFRATGDTRYRSRAIAIFRWLDVHLRSGTELDDHIEGAGHTVDWQFTYNYGAYLEAAAELSRLTQSAACLARATAAAERGIADLASDGILRDEGTGDAGGFKGIFVRDLAAFARATGQTRFLDFLASNARVASANARSDSLWGPAWNRPPRAGPIESLTDHSAVALFLVAPSASGGAKAMSITDAPRKPTTTVSASIASASIASASIASASTASPHPARVARGDRVEVAVHGRAAPADTRRADQMPSDPRSLDDFLPFVGFMAIVGVATVTMAAMLATSRGRHALRVRGPRQP